MGPADRSNDIVDEGIDPVDPFNDLGRSFDRHQAIRGKGLGIALIDLVDACIDIVDARNGSPRSNAEFATIQ